MTEQECRALFFREAYVLASSEPEMYRGFKLGLKIGSASELRRLHEVNAELVEALREAKESIMDWGAYAGEYFQNKYDLDGDIAKVEEALAKAEGK